MVAWATITKPTAGTSVSKANFGDKVVDDLDFLYALADMAIWFPLNDATALTTGAKAYWRVPDYFVNGITLIKGIGWCKVASSLNAITFVVKKNALTSMFSTNITIDQSETDSKDALVQPVVDTANDDLVAGDYIEVSVTGAGTGVEFAAVQLTIRSK